jgi:peroxiredoxin
MATTVTEGAVAPSFELAGMEGKSYSLEAALKNGPVFAVFFKVNCPTCQFTLPFIERLYQQFRSEGIQIWGISQDVARDSRRFTEQFGITFPVLIDEEPYEISQQYGLVYVPTFFLISADAQVKVSGDGFSKHDLLEVQKWFAKHFSRSPADLFKASEKIPEYKPG